MDPKVPRMYDLEQNDFPRFPRTRRQTHEASSHDQLLVGRQHRHGERHSVGQDFTVQSLSACADKGVFVGHGKAIVRLLKVVATDGRRSRGFLASRLS
jgi:hypothetical protein